MSIAVVIVCFNSGESLARCVTSVIGQTLQATRVIVVDNASTDSATQDVLSALPARVEQLLLDANVGYGAAINKAAASLSDCEFLCCLNPDAFPEPTFLEALHAAISHDAAIGSIAPLMVNAVQPNVIDGAGDVLSVSGYGWRRFHGRAIRDCDLVPTSVFSVCAGACLYRLRAITEVGGFDEQFFMYAEDLELGLRLQLAGYKCEFQPKALVAHVGSETTGYRSDFSVYWGHRNALLLVIKTMPLGLLPFALLSHIAITLLLCLLMARRGQLKVLLRAKWDALRLVGSFWRRRSSVARRQSVSSIASALHWGRRQ